MHQLAVALPSHACSLGRLLSLPSSRTRDCLLDENAALSRRASDHLRVTPIVILSSEEREEAGESRAEHCLEVLQ